jgi:hypothetical protein
MNCGGGESFPFSRSAGQSALNWKALLPKREVGAIRDGDVQWLFMVNLRVLNPLTLEVVKKGTRRVNRNFKLFLI